MKNDVWRSKIYGKGGYGLVVWKREKDIILKKKTKVSWKSLCNREMRIYFAVEEVVFDEEACLAEIFFWDSTRLKAFVSKIKKKMILPLGPFLFSVFPFQIYMGALIHWATLSLLVSLAESHMKLRDNAFDWRVRASFMMLVPMCYECDLIIGHVILI